MISKMEIPLSKSKLLLYFLACIVFITISILYIITPESFFSPIMKNQLVIRLTGIVGVVILIPCTGVIIKKKLDKTPGLIIDENGIINNTNAIRQGLIEWRDIINVSQRVVQYNKFMLIHVKKPDKYIMREKNLFFRWLSRMNNRMYGTPITITHASIKINFDDLETLIKSKIEENKQ